jgi:hypothetical protein
MFTMSSVALKVEEFRASGRGGARVRLGEDERPIDPGF